MFYPAASDGTLAVVPLPEVDTTLDVPKHVSTRPRRPSRTSQPEPSADEQKKKRRRLRRVSSFDEDASTLAPAAEEMTATGLADIDPNGCAACVVTVEDEEEENEAPLTRKTVGSSSPAVEVVEFLLLPCLPLLVCKNCPWPILIKL